ncbi:two-component sensor histidine kinase [Myxococcus xanthus]|uniref:sensor histidine kinase n=1 Tax=Myxococcus xanthus TaxID=34 RepID=UPI00112A909E|nr:HAMP domain-containing sensor histidine kinase [Myxococcus xanthus]QDE90364.1 two-component sensor histidine kinase [Myxococcus xanthus]
MRLVRRMWLWGAVVPVVAVVAALGVAVQVFRVVLERTLDEALLSQAAAESVSLFDAPDGRPHLHVEPSPLAGEVRAFVPATRLYGPDGTLLSVFPPESPTVYERVLPEDGPTSRLETQRLGTGLRLRVLTVQVRSPKGVPHVLQLVASLGTVDQAVGTFTSVATVLALLLGGVLIGIQGWQARGLARRLHGIADQVARSRDGGMAAPVPVDEPRDEIMEVRLALTEAAVRVRAAREAQERLIARAAHELRTPLALMRTGLDLALRRERGAEELRTVLEENRREVDRLASVAGALLELSAAGGALDLQQRDLRGLLDEAAAGAWAEADRRGVSLRVVGPDEADCRMDAMAVRRAVDNLLANALRYAPRGSEVRLELAHRDAHWEVAVQDEGRGIPETHREDVFTPFHRLERDAGGVGLGLSLVREVARGHGGDARVVESPGPGARVLLMLPGR